VKKIEAIIRPEQFNLVERALVDYGIASMTVSHIYGSDRSEGYLKSYRGIKFVTKLLPTIKLEIVVENSLVDSIVTIILDSTRTEKIDDGKIFIIPIFETICIQTAKKNENAIESAKLAIVGTGV
jgi:nitrogen regulatory protein P-II 1